MSSFINPRQRTKGRGSVSREWRREGKVEWTISEGQESRPRATSLDGTELASGKDTGIIHSIRRGSSYLREVASEVFVVKQEDCVQCQSFYICKEHGSFNLISYEEIPGYMRGNPYLTGGYRPPELTTSLCVKSLFHINNETINIWTHIIGLVFFSVCQVYDNLYSLPRVGANWMDHLIVSSGLLCFQICMLMSALFHIFWCISERSHQVWLTMDLLGVSSGLLGAYLTGIYYAFYCFPSSEQYIRIPPVEVIPHPFMNLYYIMWHHLYMAIFCVLGFLTVGAPFYPDYASNRLYWHRLVLYVAVAGYGVIPSIHWVFLHGGLASEFTIRFLPNVLVVYGLAALALFFYLLMIPERWLPGKFDIVGWSHQWWHLLIWAALAWWRYAGLEILSYRKRHACSGIDPSLL